MSDDDTGGLACGCVGGIVATLLAIVGIVAAWWFVQAIIGGGCGS